MEETIKMARAAQRNGADVRLIIDPDVHHEAWEKSLRQRRYVGMAAGTEKERIRTTKPPRESSLRPRGGLVSDFIELIKVHSIFNPK